ncbi:hypothetical protein BGZ51_001908 [Haplosporangium sp. Z 767]|nr:hypothetical protein BGZ51_001908 [Haplosporangium sp. Z 767]
MHLAQSFSFAAFRHTSAITSRHVNSLCAGRYKRTLWTATTCSHPDLATALSRCFPSASTTSTSTVHSSDAKSAVTIVLASRSYPGSDLLALPSKIPTHITQSSVVLGAVVDRVPTHSGHGVSTLTLTPTPTNTSSPSSLPSTSRRLLSFQPFYLSGAESRRRRLKEKSVGKWARSQDIQERSLDTADAWSAFKSISIGQNQVQVPHAVLPPSSASGSQSEVKTEQDILMISDLEVHQFLEALDTANSTATKIGLLASSTPFITGRPVTMFFDGQLVQDGVLGVSLIKEAVSNVENRTSVDYPSMAPLGPAMQITRCRGNIILELDESNATRLLLDRLQATTLTKDKEYFLATGEPKDSDQDQDANIDMIQAKVYKITGGDPSKGNMAVDTVHDLKVGQWVQFIHHDQAQDYGHFDAATRDMHGLLRFTATDPNRTIEEQEQDGQYQEEPAHSVFGGSSENGFIVGQPHSETWVCAVADSIVKHTL